MTGHPVMAYVHGRTIEERFWDMVNIRGPNDCWVWLGFINDRGYGQFRLGDHQQVRAHRFAFENKIGPIEDGLLILHTCDNPSCVNPAHLKAGTQADNIQDCISKGRRAKTRNQVNSILPEIKKKILNLYGAGFSQGKIAKQCKCSQATVSRLITSLGKVQ